MAVSALTAAKTLAEATEWRLSHLALEKILSLTHMTYMGWHAGEPLISESFVASDCGPILPSLYRKASIFAAVRLRTSFTPCPISRTRKQSIS